MTFLELAQKIDETKVQVEEAWKDYTLSEEATRQKREVHERMVKDFDNLISQMKDLMGMGTPSMSDMKAVALEAQKYRKPFNS